MQKLNLQPLALLRVELQQAAPRLGIAPAAVGQLPSHRVFLTMVLDGTLPAERVAGRWYYRRARLPEIAEALGLLPAPAPAAEPTASSAAA